MSVFKGWQRKRYPQEKRWEKIHGNFKEEGMIRESVGFISISGDLGRTSKQSAGVKVLIPLFT